MSDLVGVYEIAELAEASVQAVNSWQKRYPDFPQPIVRLHCGPIFSRAAVEKWLKNRQKWVRHASSL